jgi:hypothetical protein
LEDQLRVFLSIAVLLAGHVACADRPAPSEARGAAASAEAPPPTASPSTPLSGACEHVQSDDVEPTFGPQPTRALVAKFNTCYVFEHGVDTTNLTRAILDEPNMFHFEVFPCTEWDEKKSPDPGLDRPLTDIGDEAIDWSSGAGQSIAVRKGTVCFIASGKFYRPRAGRPEQPVEELARKIAARL